MNSSSGVWRPRPGSFSFNPMTRGVIDIAQLGNSPVHFFIIDIDFAQVSIADMQQLHSMGRVASAYFSSGTTEPYERPDVLGLPTEVFDDLTDEGSAVDRWINVTHEAVRNLMRTRINRAKALGADAVTFDFPMSPGESNKFRFTADGLDEYMRFLVDTAHAVNLSCGACDPDHNIPLAAQIFDFAFVTQCVSDGDCVKFSPFVAAGKAVFNVEYRANATLTSQVPPIHCNVTAQAGVDSVLKGTRSFYEFEMLPIIPCHLKDISRSARDIATADALAPLFTPAANNSAPVGPSTSGEPLSLPIIIGIVVAAAVCVIVVIVGALVLTRRRQNNAANGNATAAATTNHRGSDSQHSPSSTTSLGAGVVLRSRPLSLTPGSLPTMSAGSMPYAAMPYNSGAGASGGFGGGFAQSFKTPEQVYADDLLRLAPYGGNGGGGGAFMGTNSAAIRMANPTHYTYDDIHLATLGGGAQSFPMPPQNGRGGMM